MGVEALHIFTVVWIVRSFESKSETYGAIGGSLSILLWAYFLGRILSAFAGRERHELAAGHPERRPASPLRSQRVRRPGPSPLVPPAGAPGCAPSGPAVRGYRHPAGAAPPRVQRRARRHASETTWPSRRAREGPLSP